jgi:hypothetical protein
MSHYYGLAIYIKRVFLRAKKNYENSNIYFTMQKYNLKTLLYTQKKKKPPNPSSYYNSITNLKFQHKPKYHLSKILV